MCCGVFLQAAVEAQESQRGVLGQTLGSGGAAETIRLEPTEIRALTLKEVERIAIGNPDVADVTIVSASEVLVQAKQAGKTNLIVWDQQGQHIWALEVVDSSAELMELQLTQLLMDLKLPGVRVKRSNGTVLIVGEVPEQENLDQLDELLAKFPGVSNLVTVSKAALVEEEPVDLVKLSVQILEVNRSDLEKLGVDWSDAITFTEPAVSDLTGSKILGRLGTSIDRTKVEAIFNALIQQNRARILAEPKLVTASGKKASSFIGVDVPIFSSSTQVGTAQTTTQTQVEFRQTGVTLNMTPVVQEDLQGVKRIATVIEAELSDLDTSVALTVPSGGSTVTVPGFKTRKVNTEVTLASGESVVIAGLLEAKDSQASSGVPALSSIPFLGRLFRTPENKLSQNEIVILITPELLGPAAGRAPARPDMRQKEGRGDAIEQAMAVARSNGGGSSQDPALSYALLVQGQLAQGIEYPADAQAQGLTGRVKLRLHLLRDGTLERTEIAEPSGVEAFDRAALSAASAQAPYPAFPPELAQPDLSVEVPVVFGP